MRARSSSKLPWASSLAIALVGCGHAAAEPWRGCKLCFDSVRLPGLQRQADPGPPTLFGAPHCAALPTDRVADQAESVDDLDALLDRGRVCVSGNRLSSSHPCPSLSAQGWRVLSGPLPSNGAASCANAPPSCPNQTLTIARSGGDPLRLEFYDDPSGHRRAEQIDCKGGDTLSPCYYRLGRIASELRL